MHVLFFFMSHCLDQFEFERERKCTWVSTICGDERGVCVLTSCVGVCEEGNTMLYVGMTIWG